jgi:hypothetical protein
MGDHFRAFLDGYAAFPSTPRELRRLPAQLGTVLRAIGRRIRLTRQGIGRRVRRDAGAACICRMSASGLIR